MTRLLKEPLLQFLVAGLVLYAALSWLSPDRAQGGKVIVSQAAMLEFFQYRHKSFNAASASDYWTNLPLSEQDALVNEFVRDEVLFREASRLGLDAGDQIVRQRLIQKVEFVIQGFDEQSYSPSDDEIRSHFADNRAAYLMPATATFTHVFLSNNKYTPDELERRTSELLAELEENQVPFNQAGKYGDPFHFQRNYVSRNPNFVASHFGSEFSKQLFELEQNRRWAGPFESPYGLHLVMLKRIEPSWIPEYEDVAGSVLADIRKTRQDRMRDEAFSRIADKYQFKYLDVPAPKNAR